MKKGITHYLKKHRWDETLVIAVMVVAALGVLILLAAHISVTGEAIATQGSVEAMLSQSQLISGPGKTRCNVECAKLEKTCIVAWEDQKLTTCEAKIVGGNQCLCAVPAKIVTPVEKPSETEEAQPLK